MDCKFASPTAKAIEHPRKGARTNLNNHTSLLSSVALPLGQ